MSQLYVCFFFMGCNIYQLGRLLAQTISSFPFCNGRGMQAVRARLQPRMPPLDTGTRRMHPPRESCCHVNEPFFDKNGSSVLRDSLLAFAKAQVHA